MPVYDFLCKDCGNVFELICEMDKRDKRRVCPKCHLRHCKRMVGAPNVTFPGARSFAYKQVGNKMVGCDDDDPARTPDMSKTEFQERAADAEKNRDPDDKRIDDIADRILEEDDGQT